MGSRLDVATGQPDGWARARWRLRDLRGRDRLCAIGMFALVLVPFAVALVRAFRDGWVPSGDEANIATRALDVFSRHPPLTGLPSTSGFYGDKIQTNHPGPIEFYLLAAPLRVLGMSVGPLLTAATINAAFVLVALWVFFRRLGLTAMLWTGVLLLAVMWSAGTAVLTDTLSSNMTLYSLLCTAVLAWALVDGDLPLLPLAAFVASYTAQQHLAAGLVVLPLVLVATVALPVQIVMRVRRGQVTLDKATRWWLVGAVAVAGVCWAPVAVDEVTGHPGNMTQIVRFGRDNTRATLGLNSAVDQVLHAVTPPTVLGRTDTSGSFFLNRLGPYRFTLGVLVVGALCILAWGARARSRALSRLALLALLLLIAGFVNGSNVPQSFESGRINLYRWTWAAAFVTWTALGTGVALLVGRAWDRISIARRAARFVPAALLVVAAIIATSVVFVQGSDDHNGQQPAFALEKRVAAAVLARIDRHRPVVIVDQGNDASLTVGTYLLFRLVEAGVPVEVPGFLTATYGAYRRYHPRAGASAIVVLSGKDKLPSAPGELITIQRFAPERTALLDDLSDASVGRKVRLAPDAGEFIDREYPGLPGIYLRTLLAHLSTDPRSSLEQPAVLRLVLEGMVLSPALDETKVRRLRELSQERHTVAGDERVAVRLVRPDQVQTALFAKLLTTPYPIH